MQIDGAEKCVNSRSKTLHAWLKSLSASPSAGYLFVWAIINDGEGEGVVTMGGNAISNNMFKVVDTYQ